MATASNQPLFMRPVNQAHSTPADPVDDAVVAEGATYEDLGCQGSRQAYGIAVWRSVTRDRLTPPDRRRTLVCRERE